MSVQNPLGLIKRDAAAKQLGVSVKTLRKYVRQGKLKAVRFSKTSLLQFREADLRQFVENSRDFEFRPRKKGGHQ